MVYITYTTAAWDFADIYTHSPRALGVYISKIPRSHGITITYTTGLLIYTKSLNVCTTIILDYSSIFAYIFVVYNMVCGQIKGCHQCYKSVVNWFTNNCNMAKYLL